MTLTKIDTKIVETTFVQSDHSALNFQSAPVFLGSRSKAAFPTDISTGPVGGAVKRLFDLCFATLGLIAVLPLFAVVAVIVRLSSPGPVFFRHERIGFDGERFGCTKFRTMHVDADVQLAQHLANDADARAEFEEFRKLRNDPRIIPIVGNLLRKSSLDELPQLFDVLLGHMSIVGPRPVTEEEVSLYGAARREYLACRPGVTGLWQVSGRNDLSFQQRVDIDRAYVRSWSFGRDLGIIFKTVKVLINREGAL
jgi:lipopolysaccharide/colanic/teichoic acid biosynthesis glycosyltransferase